MINVYDGNNYALGEYRNAFENVLKDEVKKAKKNYILTKQVKKKVRNY